MNLNLNDTIFEIAAAILDRPAPWRRGQTAFNSLYDLNPRIANIIRSTPADPFHVDGNLNDFFAVIVALWEGE